MYLFRLIFFTFLIFASIISKASVLDEVKKRGYLKCGVSEPTIGFSNIDDLGNWKGFDVDICKAIAVAIFGDTNQVEFVQTTNRSRFPVLFSGEVDVLSRVTTWTFSRDVNLEFEFTDINFFDGQGFMVKSSLNLTSAKDLDGSSICVIENTSTKNNIDIFFDKNKIKYEPIFIDLNDEALESFVADRCDVYSNYVTELIKVRINLPNSSNYKILPEIISKEPLAIVVRHGDDNWRDVVSWSFKVMLIAEELNINSTNVDMYEETTNGEIMRLLGQVGAYGDMIELDEKWSYNIIKYVGNYKEIYERNLGPETIVNLERGLNNLYNNGGLLYAPPFR